MNVPRELPEKPDLHHDVWLQLSHDEPMPRLVTTPGGQRFDGPAEARRHRAEECVADGLEGVRVNRLPDN
jgi:hypothetical protein